MSNNLPNIELPVNEWVDLYQLTGIEVGIALSIENIGVCDVYLAVQATKPAADHESYNIVKRKGPPLKNSVGDLGAWAFCNSKGGKVNVYPVDSAGFYPPVTARSFVDGNGRELFLEKNGGWPVNIQDQTSEIIDLYLSLEESVLVIDQNTAVDDTQVLCTLDPGFNPNTPTGLPLNATLSSRIVCFKEAAAFYQAKIVAAINQGGDQWLLTLDTPLDFAFTTTGGCSVRTVNMAVQGSLASPITFSLSPSGLSEDIQWDITRHMMIFQGEGTGAQSPDVDMSNFGTQDPLVNGMVWRKVNGTTKNFFNAKTNAELKNRMYDVDINPADRFGLFTTSCRRSYAGQDKNGVVVRLENNLDPALADRYDVIFQDDMTDHEIIEGVLQGHLVTN